jgi:phosphoribosylaminoimidazole carboxylase, PurK protein
MLLPNSKIGIIGGGQLGKMLAMAATTMGYQTIVLDENADAPAFTIANEKIVGKLTDYKALQRLVKQADVVTYEFENIDAHSVEKLQKAFGKIPQGAIPLYIAQNRVREKEALAAAKIPIAPYKVVANIYQEFTQVAEHLGYPFVLKTQEGGYDGKGQVVINSKHDFPKMSDYQNIPCVAEAFVPYDYECSIIAVKNIYGEIKFFPVAKNVHKNGILETSIIIQGDIPATVTAQLEKYISNFMQHYNIVGILTFEAFVVDDMVYINEIAPRPHNSGHYTIEACMVSQFEQQIRAICGMPLAQTDLLADTQMFNILGQHKTQLFKYLETMSTRAHLHLYGKKVYQHNRKMGHITFLNANKTELQKFKEEVLNGGK